MDKSLIKETASHTNIFLLTSSEETESDSSQRCTAKAVRVREKTARVFLIPRSHCVLEKRNFTEKVFKTPTKQGGVRGTAFSVLPLALKVTFPHCHQLIFPQREGRITWEAKILNKRYK